MRKRLLRLFTRARHLITVGGAQPFAKHFWGRGIWQLRQFGGGRGNLFRAARSAMHCHGAHQQSQCPNRTSVGIGPAGGRHHLLLAFAAESPYGLSKRNIRRTLPALLRQRLKRGGQAVRGALH